MTKRCYVCKENKSIDCFGNKKTNKDGLQRICKDCQKIERKKYYEANKEKEFENHKIYETKYRDRINIIRSKRRASMPEYYKSVQEYINNRKGKDLSFLVLSRVRSRISRALALQGATPCIKIRDLLGCTIHEYIEYLQGGFEEEMSWEKYRNGEMQIDHIIPCIAFDLSKSHHQIACFNYTNTRMLWRSENLSKRHSHNFTNEEIEKIASGYIK